MFFSCFKCSNEPYISAPQDLRYNSEILFRNTKNSKTDSYIQLLMLGITSTKVTNLAELRSVVHEDDTCFHKFVLGGYGELIISSIPFHRVIYRHMLTHAAMARIHEIQVPVRTAGYIQAKGSYFVVSNQSGHFLPSLDSLFHMRGKLVSWGSYCEIKCYEKP